MSEILVRRSTVCKDWRHLLTSATFLCRYRAFHGTAPLLGILFNRFVHDDLILLQFVHATPFRSHARLNWYAHDARHSWVLFHVDNGMAMVAWDPVTGEQHEVPMPDFDFVDWDATDDAWGDMITAEPPLNAYTGMSMAMSPTALVGDTVFIATCRGMTMLVEYDLGRRTLAFIDKLVSQFTDRPVVMSWEGGALGYADIQGSNLRVFSKDARPEGTMAWTQHRVIELNTVPSLNLGSSTCVAGFMEGYGVIFVSTDTGVFAVTIKSGQIKKVSNSGSIHSIIPYMSFYTPGNFKEPGTASML
ncbi:hypothetical protein QOZ80_2BG0180550 [Eleusine coracana subsp. coracana]|nr:hypothetical protein QOZ80_2BG0180550 [Eleusine coracana subsp. coracana]